MTRPAGSLRLLTVARFPIVLLIHGTTRRIESDSSRLKIVNVTAICAPSSCATGPEQGEVPIGRKGRGTERLS